MCLIFVRYYSDRCSESYACMYVCMYIQLAVTKLPTDFDLASVAGLSQRIK